MWNPSARRRVSRRPQLEALDARICPSCKLTVLGLPGGGAELRIQGDASADQIGLVGVGRTVEVNCGGQVKNFAGITRVALDTGKGADAVTVTGSWGRLSRLDVNLGEGDDRLAVSWADFSSPLRLSLTAGAGNDRVALTCNGFHSALNLDVDLEAGKDAMALKMNTFAGATAIHIGAGEGNDAVFASDNTVSYGGPITLRVELGQGDDSLQIQRWTFAGPPRAAADSTFLVDGGQGHDTCLVSPQLKVTRCEDVSKTDLSPDDPAFQKLQQAMDSRGYLYKTLSNLMREWQDITGSLTIKLG